MSERTLTLTPESVVQAFLDHWVGSFGVPHRLLTDNGSNFSAALSEDIYILLKIQKLWTSPYHPQTDGLVERFNRTLLAMLSHFINDLQNDWDQFLPLLTLAYNSTYNYTIQQTPFFLMFGRPPPTIVDLLLYLPQGQSTVEGGETRRAMKIALNATYDNLIRKQTSQAQQSARELEAFKPYALGDRVLILDQAPLTGLKQKLRRSWIGPYIVSAVNGPLSYEVTSANGLKKYRVHAEHMKYTYNRNIPESKG